MIPPLIELYTEGKIYTGWTGGRLTRDLECFAHVFEFECAYSMAADEVVIDAGKKLELKIDDVLVLTGYIDYVEQEVDGEELRIRVGGRSKTADLIDCAAGVLQIKDRDAKSVATTLCAPFGISVVWDTERTPTNITWKIEPAETCFEVLGMIARENNLILTTNGSGDAVFTEAKEKNAGTVTLGEDILALRTLNDMSCRYSDYICMGSNPRYKETKKTGSESWASKGTKKSKLVIGRGRAQTTVNDEMVTRYRPTIILNDDTANGQNTREHAEYERDRAIAEGRRINVTVCGWHIDAVLWNINQMLTVEAPRFGLKDSAWLIVVVSLTIDDSAGYVTELELAPPEGYSSKMYNTPPEPEQGKRGKKKKKGPETWAD